MKKILICIALLWTLGLNGQDQTMGLFLNDELAFNGYTLFSNNQTSYLIDNCGKIVNTWESEYKSGGGIYILENGDLLRAGFLPGSSFNAGGSSGVFELYNWAGELKWQYFISSDDMHAHHDIQPLPNGNFLCVVWDKKSAAEATAAGRKFGNDVWSEKILEIEILPDDQANIVWEWTIWDHLIQDYDASKTNYGVVAEHPELLDLNYIGVNEQSAGDWMHINSVAYNEALDQIAFSSRHLSEVYIIDHSTTTEEAAGHTGGQFGKGGDILFRYGNPQVYDQGTEADKILSKQHDFNWVYNSANQAYGFSVFNNEFVPNQQSAVHIFENPADENGFYPYDSIQGFGEIDILRTYIAEGLHSGIQSSVQVLPNGNLFILEGRQGHMTEASMSDEIVWEYINPVNRNSGPAMQGANAQNNGLFRARRYGPNYSGFEGRTLEPGLPIELSPLPSSCGIFSSIYEVDQAEQDLLKAYGHPVIDFLNLEYLGAQQRAAIITDSAGLPILNTQIQPGMNQIDLSNLRTGLYILTTADAHIRFVKMY